ncbi:MAG TPA: type II toxin-antitoxin system VapC family toxin [Verrucomicrobiae bacterium]|nr:type II toxin-antitoxin system VapC family toxin [Verrucomicrobiae bacterium]
MNGYLLDTNVLSELVRPEPSPTVVHWMEQNRESLYTSAITIAELSYGIEKLAIGKTQDRLRAWFEQVLSEWGERILRFDTRVARTWGRLEAALRRQGTRVPVVDSYIAAVALSHSLAVATRNEIDFKRAGLRTVNPFALEI